MTEKITLHDVFEISDRIEAKLDKMEVRVSNIEIWRAQLIGQVTAVIAIINFVVAISFDWIKKQVFKNQI